MIRLLQWLLFGHVHRWTLHKEQRVLSDLHGQYTEYHLQCEYCGNIKVKDGR
jgi:hypothetical protein